MHEFLADRDRDTVISYVMDLLRPEARIAFERHVESGCLLCHNELHEVREVAGLLSITGPLSAPPDQLRDRILQITRASRVVRSQQGEWEPFCEGVAMKTLDLDANPHSRTSLCLMKPGSIVPPHHHWGTEQCYVVNGDVTMEGQVFHAGDYVRESAGTDHGAVSTANGCLLLLITCVSDLI